MGLDNFHAEDIHDPEIFDSGTAVLTFTPDGVETAGATIYIDAGTVKFVFTPITAEEVLCHFRMNLSVEMYYSRWANPVAYTKFHAVYEYPRWQAEVTVLPVPDPC
jgi:hypothetical protein